MKSNKCVFSNFNGTNQNTINRRTFFAKSLCRSAGLTLLAFPVIGTELLPAQEKKSREEILKELEAKAEKFMPMYMSCAQAGFAVLNEQFKLNADSFIPALLPFAGGIAAKGETCGAVAGSMSAIGLLFESINQKNKKQPGSSIKLGGLFFERFEKEFGSTRCREVVKRQYGRYYDFNKPEEQKSFIEESQKSGKCLEVVKKAVLIAGDIILLYS
jgi:C_GCAxxG_C_C family probable redox protein